MKNEEIKNFKVDLAVILNTTQSILITTHKDPDDDAIASVLATYYVLSARYPNKNIQMLLKDPVDNRWGAYANFDKIKKIDDVVNHLNSFEVVIFVDQSLYHMFTDYPEKITDYHGKTVAIDHHATPPGKFDLILRLPSATSTTELIYYVFDEEDISLNKPLVEIFLLGILGDTGNLRYVYPSQLEVFGLVEKLLKIADTRIDDLRARSGGFPAELLPLYGQFCQSTKIENIPNWPPFWTAFLSRTPFNKTFKDEQISKTASFFNGFFGTGIKDISWGFLLYPQDNGDVVIELRSKADSVNVRDIVEKMGIGGGHNRAAGGRFKAKDGEKFLVEDCLKQVLEWIKNNQPVIE